MFTNKKIQHSILLFKAVALHKMMYKTANSNKMQNNIQGLDKTASEVKGLAERKHFHLLADIRLDLGEFLSWRKAVKIIS